MQRSPIRREGANRRGVLSRDDGRHGLSRAISIACVEAEGHVKWMQDTTILVAPPWTSEATRFGFALHVVNARSQGRTTLRPV